MYFFVSIMQQIIYLNDEQIETVLRNLWKVRNVKHEEILFNGKINMTKEEIKNIGCDVYTKLAENYCIHRCKSIEDNHNELYIIVKTTQFDKQNILAIEYFTPMLQKYFEETAHYKRPLVNICLPFTITDVILSHIPVEFIVCYYRIYSLCKLYPMLGSKNNLFGLTYDYHVIDYEETYNGKNYSTIDAGDPMVIAVNAIEGDLIVCQRIIYDTNAYSDTQIKRVVNKVKDLSMIANSGCPIPIRQDYTVVKNV